ncbi:MAG TPA: thiamine-phosphate kinase [Flavobacteriales bacterium]|nr:thiamine-phosphate kinase [Flavobacteriales bacterium]
MENPAEKQPTPLSELGEFKLIERLTKKLTSRNKNVVKGIGDDAAVIKTGGKEVLLVTSDMLCEGVHFDLLYSPAMHLGYKAVVVNLSDIFAMNGEPQQVTVSLGLSNRMSVEFLEELYKGMQLACEQYNVEIVGGDTVSSQSGLVISITAMGTAGEKEVTYRSTAGENDLICVSGDLGAAYMGLQLLEREKTIFESDKGIQPDLSGNDYILERQLKPEARKDVIAALKLAGIKPTSMIDISDGLSSDLLHLTEGSGIGANIYEEKIPIDPATAMMAEQFNIGPVTAALNGGEDYELLFTIDLKDHEKIAEIPGISIIGHMTGKNEAANLVTISNTVVPIRATGWQAFGNE